MGMAIIRTENGRNTAADCVKTMLGNGKWFQVKWRLLANIVVHRTPHNSDFISKRNKQYPNGGVSAVNATRDAQPIVVWYVHVHRFDNGDQMGSHIYSKMHSRTSAFVPLSLCIAIAIIIAICIQHRTLYRVITQPRCFQFMIRDSRCIYMDLRASSLNQSRSVSWKSLVAQKKWNERMKLFRLGIICATPRTARPFGIDRNSISVHRSQFSTCSNNVRHIQLYQRFHRKFIFSRKMCHTHARVLQMPSTIRPCIRTPHSINNLQYVSMMRWKLNWTNVRMGMYEAKQV